jgi:hypothetical protein
MRAGRYRMRSSRFFMMAASWRGELQEPRLPRLAFIVDQAPSTGFSSGAYPGSRAGQPLIVRLDEGTHQGSDVRVQVAQQRLSGAWSSWCAAVTRFA